MPPSPAFRCSPGRDQRMDNHKRGRSLEGGLLFKEQDDDLALFNEMQSRERENFLLQSSDDFEDTFSAKLKHFSDVKLGVSIPVRGESSELLNADGEKNDYDWLLTPPDTPLFPSLDDEPPPVNVASRGRPRSQPISISRSYTIEKSYRSSRGSPSPNRSSPSPRSGSSTFQSSGRLSSALHSSPTPSQRSATPLRRPSPPPSKASTPAPRSLTPTPMRMSTGPGVRGASPIRTSRGNSVSPKIRAWQSNIPGFSSEAPPNLRTSLADRPASYVRGSSPASRNGRDSSSKFGRQSMSPTASRSISSSHSQDRDRNSSHSKGSIASSGDDDADSLQSIHVGSLDRLASRRVGTIPNSRTMAVSKKSSRILSPSSAPKKSFDSALRQMDHRKTPQNMFRPLLSGVPSTTFYAGKPSSVHRSLISRNSSVTTSSNASSNQVTRVAPDTEGSDHHREDMAVESGKVFYADSQDEVFAFDKLDTLNKGVGHDADDDSLHFQLDDCDRGSAVEREPGDSEEFGHQDIDMENSSTSDSMCIRADFYEVDSLENMKVCSKCGCRYRVIETVEKDINLCPDCSRQDKFVAAGNPETAIIPAAEEYKLSDEPKPPVAVSESQPQVVDMIEACISQDEDNIKQGETSYSEQSHSYSQESSLTTLVVEGAEQRIASQQGTGQAAVGYSQADCNARDQQLLHSKYHSSLKVDTAEGAGISVLLRSSSSKGPVVQGRTFIASAISYDDLSYARDSVNSLRSSIGHGNISASSSVDFSSARQVETRVQRQLSSKKSDRENYRYDSNTRPQSAGSSLSGTVSHGSHAYQASGLITNMHEQVVEILVGNMQYDGVEEATVVSHGKVMASETKEMYISDTYFTGGAVLGEHSFEQNESCKAVDSSFHSCEIEDFPSNARSLDVETSAIPSEPFLEPERDMRNANLDGLDVAEGPTQSCLPSISEIEVENYCQSNPCSENDDISANSKSIVNEFHDFSVTTPSDKDMAASVLEQSTSDHVHGIIEESIVTVECQGGSKSRSLTLEEVTDTILFCSSIVHDLAYEAATIAIEKESSAPLEGSRPTVTVLGKSTADRKDSRSRTSGKRPSKSLKSRQKRVETDAKPPSCKIENDENVNEPFVRNVGLANKMDSMKPPKLESKCNCTIM